MPRPNLSRLLRPHKRAVLFAAAALSACGDGATDATPPPPPSFALSGVSALVPGTQATITGRAFNTSLPATLTVDGQPAALTRVSDTQATFIVPTLRPCETDGRRVPVTAGTASVPGTLDLPDAVALEAGQSQVLPAAEVACLKLPAADQAYVLTALNLEDYPITVDPNAPAPVRSLLDVTTFTAAGGEPTGSFTASVPMVHRPWNPTYSDEPRGPFSAEPTPFDPAYATARVGDQVRFVDWAQASRIPGSCSQNRATAPSYPVQIVALARDPVTGADLVIAADMREPSAPDHVSEAGRQYWQMAADRAAPLLTRTMRAVFDPAYEPLAGGGRRVYTIISNTFGAAAVNSDGGTGQLQSFCPLASEMITVLIGPQTTSRTTLMARTAATAIVHEVAHNADAITSVRLAGRQRNAAGWFGEAFASLAEETAARIASGQDMGAQESRITDAHPAFHRAGLVWGAKPDFSPLRGSGEYALGSSLLMFSREMIGNASVTAAGPHLYQQMLLRAAAPAQRWTLPALASVVGVGVDELLDRWSLAHATDDLVSGAAAAAHGLPQIASWDHGTVSMPARDELYRHPPRSVSRATNTRRTLGAQPGNYAAAYFFAEGGAGVSLSLGSPASRARFRLTRLR